MPRLLRSLWTLFALMVVLATAAPARAWVEQEVKSDSATVDVERDGRAVVTHELLLRVRGGPLSSISIEPVDEDAELLDGATATIAESGHAASLPLSLTGSKDGARATLRIEGTKGLRTGTYLIRFSYRTNLGGPAHLRTTALGTSFEWSGPSFADGIDSEKVVFRFPSASVPPHLGPSDGDGDTENVADDRGGVFLSTLRRVADKDELEVVRPHVAKNEVVSWRARVDPSVFDVATEPASPPGSETRTASPGVSKVVPQTERLSAWWGAIAALALAFGAAVAFKSRSFEGACRRERATPRPLLPIPTPLRAVLASAFVLSAAGLVVASLPALSALCLLGALASATHLPPRIATPLRGPGKWTELEPEVAFAESLRPRTPGRFVDSGNPLGFSLFVSLLVGFVAAAVFAMHRSEYYGLSVALGSALLFPIFCTGREAELPPDPVHAPAELLDWLMAELGKSPAFIAKPIGRFPLGRTEPDEIRLLVSPKIPLNGFVGIEVGRDVHQGALGLLSLSFVLVRVLEGSPAADALPKGLFWTRGRTADERVAVLRPKVATRRMTALLVGEVARRLSAAKVPSRRQPGPTSAIKAAGRGSNASKPGTTSSPAHAT